MLKERRTYSISEAAKALGVSTGWLRFGERLGSLPLARRTRTGWRYYTPEDIERTEVLTGGSAAGMHRQPESRVAASGAVGC